MNRKLLRPPSLQRNPSSLLTELPDWWATNPYASQIGFSYCITSRDLSRVRNLVDDLVRKTTANYEILLWVAVDLDFEKYVADMVTRGIPISIKHKSPRSTAIRDLFEFCQCGWVMQIDCDTPHIVDGYNPKVSIIIPTYKRQHVLMRTVKSVLVQSYKNWELIIVNNEVDGVLPGFTDPRISVYDHSGEANACYARNMGVRHVTGDLVNFFDDDDEMLPGYLEKMVAPFSDPEIQVVRCGMLCAFGACDFSYSTQEAWLRRAYATPTWEKGSKVHDQIYYRSMIKRNGWKRENIIQLGEVLVRAYTEPSGGIRAGGF